MNKYAITFLSLAALIGCPANASDKIDVQKSDKTPLYSGNIYGEASLYVKGIFKDNFNKNGLDDTYYINQEISKLINPYMLDQCKFNKYYQKIKEYFMNKNHYTFIENIENLKYFNKKENEQSSNYEKLMIKQANEAISYFASRLETDLRYFFAFRNEATSMKESLEKKDPALYKKEISILNIRLNYLNNMQPLAMKYHEVIQKIENNLQDKNKNNI